MVPVGFSWIQDGDPEPSPVALVFTIGAVAISLLGSVPPARRAARLNIIEAVSVE
jgi:putative ABC transport system permease protein